jgi:hypothetical protein
MQSSGMLRHVALVRTEVSEARIASIIKVTNRRAIHSSETSFLQEPHSVTSQKTIILKNSLKHLII